LKERYRFDVKIPFCKQLNKDTDEEKLKKKTKKDQPLTPRQAADSRLVTKVRFQVEYVNSQLKAQEALDYVRNSRLGYLNQEYRIMCAMLNFTHKPNLTDKPNTIKVAKMIRARYEEPQFNDLEFLLNKQLGTNLFQETSLEGITDFVTLKRKQMSRFIFNGSFHLKRAKSYLIDLVRQKDSVYTVNKSELNKLVYSLPEEEKYRRLKTYILDPKAKIVVTKVFSRHKRAIDKTISKVAKKSKKSLQKVKKLKLVKKKNQINTTTNINLENLQASKEAKCLRTKNIKNSYKVLICYMKEAVLDDEIENAEEFMQEAIHRTKKFKSIKSFICSCMNGKKIISPCIHISSTIYYLAWAKYRPLRYPGEYLNSIFLQSSNQQANNPK